MDGWLGEKKEYAIGIAVLAVVAVLIVWAYMRKDKDGFGVTAYNNLATGSNNPIWELGSGDAGNWGPVHRGTTLRQAAVYHPSWRVGPECHAPREAMTHEGMEGNGEGIYAQVGNEPPPLACNRWGVGATVETQGLTAAQVYGPTDESDPRFQMRVDGGEREKGPGVLTDAQLEMALFTGDAS